MLRLLLITSLLAAAAAQQYFYCNDNNPVTIVNQRDFYLVTRRPSESGFSEGLSCEFNAESVNSAFLVEIQSFRVNSAVLTIRSGGQTLFSGSSIPDYKSSITTPSKSLQVQFNANGDHSNGEGVKIRVRVMSSNGCPPGWVYLYGDCFGTSSTSNSLNFFDAQRACNSMRSNLLQLPNFYSGTLRSFMRQLPYNLRAYFTWVGLTDRTGSGQYKHYWLKGSREYKTSEISCVSGGSYYTCYSYERCGTMLDRSSGPFYAIYMDSCTDRNPFACSMPPGGTSVYYRIPGTTTYTSYVSKAWIWGAVFGSLFVVGLIIVGVYSGLRSRNMRRAAGASSVVVTTGRVTVAPPSGSYPVQPSTQYPTAAPYPTTGPQNSAAPPTYDAAVAGAQTNAGFQK